MIKELVDLLVKSVDVVDNPANQKPFLIIKDEKGNKSLLPSDSITNLKKEEDTRMSKDNLIIDKDQAVEEAVEKQLDGNSEEVTEEITQEETAEVEKSEEVTEEKPAEEVKEEPDLFSKFADKITELVNQAVEKALEKKEEVVEKSEETTEEQPEEKVEETTEHGCEDCKCNKTSEPEENDVTSQLKALEGTINSLKTILEEKTTPETVEKTEEEPAKEEIEKSVQGLSENLKKIDERLNKIENTVTVSKSVGDGDSEGDTSDKKQESFWAGVIAEPRD